MADSPDVPDLRDVLMDEVEWGDCFCTEGRDCLSCRNGLDETMQVLAANPRALAEWAPPAVIDAVIDRAIRDGALVQPHTPEWSDLGAVLDKHGECTWMAEPKEGAVPLYRRAERSGT